MADFIDVVRRSDGRVLCSLLAMEVRGELYIGDGVAAFRPMRPDEYIGSIETYNELSRAAGYQTVNQKECRTLITATSEIREAILYWAERTPEPENTNIGFDFAGKVGEIISLQKKIIGE